MYDINLLKEAVEKKLNEIQPGKPIVNSRISKEKILKEEVARQNLFQLAVYAAKLHDLAENKEVLEEETIKKIEEATNKISQIYHQIEYKKYKESN